ncbi:LmeA family phospholipid-binding protein [Amycolatopsis lexingtonensis]|uniref:LmeA family phospholipid-binding protein n=1 Tax=Amycolatopsis lexingtonensis TaxID=218822 RepID=UPI003F7295B6
MVSRPVTRDDRPGPPPDARRRGRRARRWVIALVVLVLLLVGADFGAAAYAEHMISQKARTQLQLTDDPSVTIHGFPFLTQALGGDYRHISVSAAGLPVADKLQDVAVNAELENVSAPLSDLTAGNTKSITIGELTGSVTIKAADLARLSPLDKIKDLRVEPSSTDYVENGDSGQSEPAPTTTTGADGQPVDESSTGVRISGHLQFAGKDLEIFCFAMIEADAKGGTINFVPKRLQFGNDQETTVVPAAVQKALMPNFKASINTKDLPLSVTPTGVRVQSGSVTIKGEATNVSFADLSK